jgi:hypothetical protein
VIAPVPEIAEPEKAVEMRIWNDNRFIARSVNNRANCIRRNARKDNDGKKEKAPESKKGQALRLA